MNGHQTFWLMLVAILAPLFSACGAFGSGPDSCDAPGVLMADDFSGQQNCGWAEYNRGGSVVEIGDDVLAISSSQPGEIWWTNPGKQFEDVIINVTAEQIEGPDDNAYGVICRYQSPENFYVFLISGDGFYAIGKYQTGNEQVIYLMEEGQFESSEAINQGQASNDIRASCIGNELSLTVNGSPLITVSDPTFVTGDIGLGVSTLAPGTSVVHFDDIQVIAP